MPSASAIQNRLDRVLTRLNVTDRQVYKRVLTRIGGDPLIGRSAQVSAIDTLLSPQPSIAPINHSYNMVVAGASLTPNGEYTALVSATAMSMAEVENKDLVIVLKDAGGREEVFYIVSFGPHILSGTDIAFDLVLTSKQR